ncbi:MAG: Na+/H+ antiporter NhaA [Gemmatimonadetes bacterium]|nr:Na+/H+ antiporter NhaA [Gemmatimonadota bacterium]
MVDRRTWIESDRTIPSKFVRPVRRFIELEAASGIVLLLAAAGAMVWANTFGDSYHEFWDTEIEIAAGSIFEIRESFGELVNDALMTLFFFVVGLEIKRAVRLGDLRDPKAAALPVLAALGGMIVPALIYFAFNPTGEAASGWGIPMATDIAFALGVVALLGPRIPPEARLFLLALAIVDDIGAIVVIAIFYTTDFAFGWLLAAGVAFVLVYAAKHSQVRSMAFYWIVGGFVWYATFKSGVHATLAGVALGFLTPTVRMYSGAEFDALARATLDEYPINDVTVVDREHIDHEVLSLSIAAREAVSPLRRLEDALHPWTSFVVVPLFALANVGVQMSGIDLTDAITSSVALGVSIGLVAGKAIGIVLFAYLAVRLGIARLPSATSWGHILGLAVLGGIGFTVSLFITGLAFDDPLLSDLSRIGIFVGSIAAGIIGYLLLRSIGPTGSIADPSPADLPPAERPD